MPEPARAEPAGGEPILEVRGLTKHFPLRRGLFGGVAEHVRAVDGVDLTIPAGGTLGLVGESGSGKTTLGRCLLRLIEPTEGSIRFMGMDLLSLSPRRMRRVRQDLQVIFQDPYSSLNPRMRVGEIIGEPILIHRLAASRAERLEQVAELMETVGLDPSSMGRYPHEFSGGQRQRIGIARALGVRPKLIVADEPVSALDVSVQAQVINLLMDLQERFGIAYLFISHDLRVVEHVSDRVAGGGHVPGPDRGGGGGLRPVPRPAPSVHPSAAVGDPRPGPRDRTPAHRPARRGPFAGPPAPRMHVSPPLPGGLRAVPGERPGPVDGGTRTPGVLFPRGSGRPEGRDGGRRPLREVMSE